MGILLSALKYTYKFTELEVNLRGDCNYKSSFLIKDSSSLRHISLQKGGKGTKCKISVLEMNSQWLSIRNWYIPESQEENKSLFIKYVIYVELKKH